MITFKEYAKPLMSRLNNRVNIKKCVKIALKLLSNGTTKLFSTSDGKSEYKLMIRCLTSENKSIKLESEMINKSLL